ncbi:CAP domain-containing protein [Micrococcales bacterium 31B]|nr:CAP domain-containing protein [Micrococcales bacterium 31B]
MKVHFHPQKIAAALAIGLTVTGLSTTAALPATAQEASVNASRGSSDATAYTYFKMPYSSDIYRFDGSTAVKLTWDSFVAAGFPRYSTAPTTYVKYAWSSTLYAVTKWSSNSATWTWHRLSHAEWQAAGSPSASNIGWVAGSIIYKYGTSDQLLLRAPDKGVHVLTFSQWAATGYRNYSNYSNQGYSRLSWDSNIAYMTDLKAGKGYVITAAQWSEAGEPWPQFVKRFPGDVFYKNYGSNTVYYQGPTASRAITFNEWVAAGSPTPEVRGAPAPGSGLPIAGTASTTPAYAYDEVQRTLELVNRDRVANGLKPYRLNAQISLVAQDWSNHMASNPTAPASTRMVHRTDADLISKLPGNWITGGENIAYNSNPTADKLHTQFMNSPGHRANVLSAKFTDIGLGYTVDANGYGWITQNFAQY